MKLTITEKQAMFIQAPQFEVLFGGAAGGGKSYAQLIDSLLYASKYPESKQLILRRTFAELEKSLIRVSLEIFPREIASYNSSAHVWKFKNGSVIDFGYINQINDVYQYQSAEYDQIHFDELTHFTKEMYEYLLSRIRGTKPYPRHCKSSTNPGNIGHAWVRERFIDCAPPMTESVNDIGLTKIFIPAKVQENKFLMANDADYIKRLEMLPEKEKRALLYGEWDIFEGRFFTEWNPEVHVIKPFNIPEHWRREFVMDYGLDMLAGYWVAIDPQQNAYVYKEVYQPNLIISAAASIIKEMNGKDKTEVFYAPPDMWNRRQETGRSVAEIFGEYGVYLNKVNNGREQGWLDLKEWLKVVSDEEGKPSAKLRFFDTCRNVIRCLPNVIYDPRNPNDISNEPHELTHSCDAMRYFAASRPHPADTIRVRDIDSGGPIEDQIQSIFGDIY